ncbi:hypothetical protein EDC04DRAFT_2893503 [Pisolithus marmoratus]|nr:hypothetical protein EDC04DRAFT_2893503 [Pisolithus marmoratus]
MVLAHEDKRTHPYWYTCIIHIFHVNVEYRDPITHISGWVAKCLQCLKFFDQDNLTDAFGFLDPDCIIRGAHLIPAFAYSTTDKLPGTSFVQEWDRDSKDTDHDWGYYYVNCFVDRDMFMRFRGGVIGHKAMRDWDEFLQCEGHGVGGNGQAHDNEDDHDEPYEELASEDEVDELDNGSDGGEELTATSSPPLSHKTTGSAGGCHAASPISATSTPRIPSTVELRDKVVPVIVAISTTNPRPPLVEPSYTRGINEQVWFGLVLVLVCRTLPDHDRKASMLNVH